MLLGRSDRVTVVGRFVRDALVNHEGLVKRRIEVVHNGIDPMRFSTPPAGARQAIRAELELTGRQPVVLQVARFHPVKDHATSIRAMAAASRDVPDAMILLAGDGPTRTAAQKLAVRLGLGGRVRFLGVRPNVPHLMSASDVFILSSLSEGLCVTLLEAMASGLPVVATDVGGNGKIVVHGVTGWLSHRAAHEPMAMHLVGLLRDPDLRSRFGAEGRRRLLANFTQRQMHDRYARIY
jgi:glycosyltransferase involved in cell wall biosynthesis